MLGAIVAVACLSGAVASTASASFIYVRGTHVQNEWVYAGLDGVGEVNNVTVSQFASGGVAYYNFFENAPAVTITDFPDQCQRATPNIVFCPIVNPADGSSLHADAELHDGDDTLTMSTTLSASISGGLGADVLKGGSAADTIQGDGDGGGSPDGDDVIDGRGGADVMSGGGGTDTVSYASRSTAVNASLDSTPNDGGSGEGDDIRSDVESLSGSQGPDTLTGNGGVNALDGNGGGDIINGLGDNDTLRGGDQSDILDAGDGNDSMSGGPGGETMRGGVGNDTMDGGVDGDNLYGGPGSDDMAGGDGADGVDYAGATAPLTVTVDDGLPNDGAAGEGDNVRPDVETVLGGKGNDRLDLAGVRSPGALWGRDGNDTLLGGINDDRLEGQDGNDTLEGSYGADLMNGGAGGDTVDFRGHAYTDLGTGEPFGALSTPDGAANDGNDQIDQSVNGGGGTDDVGSDVENIIGSEGPDTLVGSAAANRITGGPGNDALHGEEGNDTLDGESGADVLDGGPDTDTATYAARTAPLRATINNVANDGETNEGDDVQTTVENLLGGSQADVLTGSGQANSITGGDGDDILNGGAGSDTIDGRAGIDTLTYSDRNSRVAVNLDGKRNDGADPDGNGSSGTAEEGDKDLDIENATGGAAGDSLKAPLADAVRNVLRGLDGNDTLNSREGTATLDSLDCGAGAGDRFAKDPSDGQTRCEVALP
jgi:Ca2+-binding RTX toxin-like protein